MATAARAVLILGLLLAAYETVKSFGIPVGILPLGVVSYTLAPGGNFILTLPSSCKVHAGGNVVKYDAQVSGVISAGSITSLAGVSANLLLLWIPISAVEVQGEEMVFTAGPITKSFPNKVLATSPKCA